MNFDPTIPSGIAIFMSLAAAFMWGTWFISLKYIGDYPLEAFYITLFTTSLILVWGVGFFLDGGALIGNLKQIWAEDPSRVLVTLLCGVLYVSGMQFSIRVMKTIGLSLSQPLSASINLIAGTGLSAVIGGVPEGLTAGRVILAAAFLIAAILLTMQAGNLRTKAQADASATGSAKVDMKKALVLLVIGALFVPAYSTALSYGLKSVTQPKGLAVMPFMAMLATGAFIGIWLICGTTLTVRKQWHVFKENGLNIHKFGILSGLAHYGGNIIHTFATRNLSSVVSWPLGITAGLWTQIWGLIYGEFKGAPKKAYIMLFIGLFCYLIGAFIISNII